MTSFEKEGLVGASISTAPKVSICIPTYCQVKFLRVALESLNIQSFQDYEIIVTDDSPDDSVERLLAAFNFKGRLRYVRNLPRKGSPSNWNEAVKFARGSYIKILHHDDYFSSPDSLARFVLLLDANPDAAFAFSGSRVEDVIGGHSWHHHVTIDQLSLLGKEPAVLFYGNFIGAPSATIYRRGLGIEYDEAFKWLVDIDFYIRMLHRYPVFSNTVDALIVTPTNANHQVTESCRANAQVELFEYHSIYLKYAKYLSKDLNALNCLRLMLEKYRVRNLNDLSRYNLDIGIGTDYFNLVRPRHWLVAKLQRVGTRVAELFVAAVKKI